MARKQASERVGRQLQLNNIIESRKRANSSVKKVSDNACRCVTMERQCLRQAGGREGERGGERERKHSQTGFFSVNTNRKREREREIDQEYDVIEQIAMGSRRF